MPVTMPRPWPAPLAPVPIRATVHVPGSKSQTNRALILAALAYGPSVITGGLDARDTRLMRDALRSLGVTIVESGRTWTVEPPEQLVASGPPIDCGLAGTVMRFVPPLAALAKGPVAFDGDQAAYGRPMGPILGALVTLGAEIAPQAQGLPFTLTGRPDLPGGVVTVDASDSSQFVSGLLLAGARYTRGIDLRHEGREMPSRPHVEMTVAMLRARGVTVDDSEPDRWVVAPGPIAPLDVTIEPDLSNAAPFLAAGAVTGGSVTVPFWPVRTSQAGDQLRAIFPRFGAQAAFLDGAYTVRGTDSLHGVDLDLRDASELTPVVAALAALADSTTHLRGIGHIRGHETDRLKALATELHRMGASVHQTGDGLVIHPKLLGGVTWRAYSDHRMAQAGALLGLVVEDMAVDDIAATDKTLPEFVGLWEQMIADAVRASDALLESSGSGVEEV